MLALTPQGMAVLRDVLAGDAVLTFKAIRLGDGENAGAATDTTECTAAALSHVRDTMEVTGHTVGDTTVEITASFGNGGVTSAYRATEMGVYIEDPDDATAELLYAYEYTAPSEADYIPAAGSGRSVEIMRVVEVYIGEATDVTVYIASAGYVTPADLEAHTGNTNNPHGVTKAQVGLGNVPNVETNDQTPTYEEAAELAGLVSGETLAAAFGKIKKAVASLITHIGTRAQNAHGETPASIGAAAASHSHSASHITTGILSVLRGGTGVSSLSALAGALLSPLLTMKSFDGDLNELMEPGIVWASANTANNPLNQCMVITTRTAYQSRTRTQICISTYPGARPVVYMRNLGADDSWGDWFQLLTREYMFNSMKVASLADMEVSGLYRIISAADGPAGFSGEGWCLYFTSVQDANEGYRYFQILIETGGSNLFTVYLRHGDNTAWQSWRKISTEAVS